MIYIQQSFYFKLILANHMSCAYYCLWKENSEIEIISFTVQAVCNFSIFYVEVFNKFWIVNRYYINNIHRASELFSQSSFLEQPGLIRVQKQVCQQWRSVSTHFYADCLLITCPPNSSIYDLFHWIPPFRFGVFFCEVRSKPFSMQCLHRSGVVVYRVEN